MARLEISSINPTGRYDRIDQNFTDLYAITITTSGGTITGDFRINGNLGMSVAPGSQPGYGNTDSGLSLLGSSAQIFSSTGLGGNAVFNVNADGPAVFWHRSGSPVGSIAVTTTTTTYNTTSDERLKEDLQTFDAGRIVDNTNVYDFKWKETGKRAYGVIAQQAVDVYDAPVYYDAATDWWGVDYSKYVPVILQELKALRARVAALEGAVKPDDPPG